VESGFLFTSSVGPQIVSDVSDKSPCQRKLLPALSCCYVWQSQFYILLRYGGSRARKSDCDIYQISCYRVAIKYLLYHDMLRRWVWGKAFILGRLVKLEWDLLLPKFIVVDCISISVWCYLSCCWTKGYWIMVKVFSSNWQFWCERKGGEFRCGLLLGEGSLGAVWYYEVVKTFVWEDGLFIIYMVAGCMFLENIESFDCF
jgi:hypothetical protein